MTSSTSLPEEEPRDHWNQPQEPAPETPDVKEPNPNHPDNAGGWAGNWPAPGIEAAPESGPAPQFPSPDFPDAEPSGPQLLEPSQLPLPIVEPPDFLRFEPAPPPPERIPNFGHLCLLGGLILFGLLCTGIIMQFALHHHLYGIATTQRAVTDIHYTLGSEGLLYLITLAACLVIFPMVWHKGFFAGIQWNAATAIHLRWRLFSAAGACFLLAFVDSVLVPGPTNAPIDKIFRAPGAAWLLFGFGVTFAPFFEETFFRGFLLPALCTAWDWTVEKTKHRPRLPLAENGHPQWTMTAMVIGSIATSLPFAALHAQQTGYSLGPFILLVGVSLVLCAIRLSTRSLASSVLVHASYNFMLFFIMLVGTHGFRHLGKM